MELKRHLDLRYLFVSLYFVAFAIYLLIGLQPVGATNYNISSELMIPRIGLKTDVASLNLRDGNLDTPESIVGSFSKYPRKTLLIGHSTTVFQRLNDVEANDSIILDGNKYHIVSKYVTPKSDISMTELLRDSGRNTIVLMTCAGELIGNGDATHRLIVVAVKD